MEQSKRDYYKDLINSYLNNEASDVEIENLREWINLSEENRNEFLELRNTWLLTSSASPRGKFNRTKYREWEKLSGRLTEYKGGTTRASLTPWQKAINVAAVILFLISIGATVAWRVTYLRLHEMVTNETSHQVKVPFGGKSEVILPDGSKVNLNAGSSFSYSSNFGQTDRNVLLEGEGYFEVESNPQMPFVVYSSDININAVGTIFNVKAYPDEKEVITTLVEGVVMIKGDNIDFTMSPNQRVTYIREQPIQKEDDPESEEDAINEQKAVRPEGEVRSLTSPVLRLDNKINIRETTSWKDGVFIFNSEKLKNLAVILERQFDITIQIESEELKDHVFTGTFHQETLEQILRVINMSAPIKYQIEKGKVNIQVDKSRVDLFRELSHI